jgi:hypothetical protein
MRDDTSSVVLAGALILFVSLAACAPSGQADPSTVPTTTATTVTTVTTTTPSSTTTTEPATSGVPVLGDGRPATFLGVTTDYEAVEVDTATGAVLRSLGQISTREDVDNAECPACVNAIDAVWRTRDGSSLLISECCEPAVGRIHQFPADATPLTRDSDAEVHQFWSATPSPVSDDIAFVGYFLQVTGPGSEEALTIDLFDRFAITNASWGRDGRTVMWLESDGDAVILRSVDISSGQESEIPLDFATGWQLTGLTARANGELLSIRFTTEGDEATGVVFTPEGMLVSEFDLEDGSRLGGYDQTGTFLAYTDGAGVARWAGEGRTGQLASGFLFVSW